MVEWISFKKYVVFLSSLDELTTLEIITKIEMQQPNKVSGIM
jgi:hypothetical protein